METIRNEDEKTEVNLLRTKNYLNYRMLSKKRKR